jgi:hypothetical protein
MEHAPIMAVIERNGAGRVPDRVEGILHGHLDEMAGQD